MDNKVCDIEDYNKEEKFLEEIKLIENNIYDILNKNIESNIDQRNDIYKYIQTTDFSDNSYFLNVKEKILKIINNDTSLLQEYNNFKEKQHGGVNFKNIVSAAFLGFTTLVNSITYHANPSDYATSLAVNNPATTLVTSGNSMNSCGFASMAVIHGDNLNLTKATIGMSNLGSVDTDNFFTSSLGLSTGNYYNKIIRDGIRMPNSGMVQLIHNLPESEAIIKLTAELSKDSALVQNILKNGRTTGEYRTLISTAASDGTKHDGGHSRVLIIDVKGNLAAYDPNKGFIYDKSYGISNPEVIKDYKNLKKKFPKFVTVEVQSIPKWIVQSQKKIAGSQNLPLIIIIMDTGTTLAPEDNVTPNSLNNMEQKIAEIVTEQHKQFPESKINERENEWIKSNTQNTKGGGDNDDIKLLPESASNQDNDPLEGFIKDSSLGSSFNTDQTINMNNPTIKLIIDNNEIEKQNPFPPNSKKYEMYQFLTLYSLIKPETSEDIEKIKKYFEKEKGNSNNPQAIKKEPKITQSEMRQQQKTNETEMLKNITDGTDGNYDFVVDKRTRKQKREDKRRGTRKGGRRRKTFRKRKSIKRRKSIRKKHY